MPILKNSSLPMFDMSMESVERGEHDPEGKTRSDTIIKHELIGIVPRGHLIVLSPEFSHLSPTCTDEWPVLIDVFVHKIEVQLPTAHGEGSHRLPFDTLPTGYPKPQTTLCVILSGAKNLCCCWGVEMFRGVY